MGTVVFILGRSGTGKSYSLRDFKPGEIGIINVQGKILPFRNGSLLETVNSDDALTIMRTMGDMAKKYKIIVIDDFQYLMANEFMRRSNERGYDKFTEIARHAWDVVDIVRILPNDIIVYIMCHTDTDADGIERLKTIGKMLDEKIILEGMSTIVLKTSVSDGQYMFLTQNNGKDTVKSPAGMFPTYAIENNLKYVDEKIRNYYGIGNCKSDAEMEQLDTMASKGNVTLEPRRRRRAETAVTPPETAETADVTPVVEERPRRRRKGVETAETAPVTDPTPTTENVTENEPPRRRRRRTEQETATDPILSEFDTNDLPYEL